MLWRLLLFEFVLMLIIVGIWFGAPLLGITSVLWRILLILALILPPIIIVLWNYWQQRKASRKLETALEEQGDAHAESARPDRQAEIAALNATFAESVKALRSSRLAGSRKGTALYALPWYMIIGPPAVGKSTALLRSGLRFPFTPGDKKAVKGVGGTRNCDWWFSDRAILLDTAGRYTSEDDDLDEWLGFLRLLRRYRRKRPLNGLLVAVSAADILSKHPQDVEQMAGKIRQRVDQVIEELHLALPIYVLITKCDLMAGFVEFFADLDQRARAQPLGFTVSLSDPESDIATIFRREFDLLASRMRERSLVRLVRARASRRDLIYRFPLQFAAAREPLTLFMETLLSPNPYGEAPRLRGVYFCSGTQEGRPVDRVMAEMSHALGLKETIRSRFEEKPRKKSYFLHDAFLKVIFPDHHLAGRTARGERRRTRLRWGLFALSALSAFLVLGWGISSFISNLQLVRTTRTLSANSQIVTPDDPRQVTDSLKALDQLGARVDLLRHRRREGAPWSMRFGFYTGNELFEPARAVYIKRMRRAFVDPAGTELEATLIDIAAATDARNQEALGDFDLLKAYLMVTNRDRLVVDFATGILLEQWRKRLHPDVADEQDILERNAKRYLALLKGGQATWLDRVPSVIQNARQALKARDAEYRQLIGNANKLLKPLILRDALRGRVQSILRAEYSVPGVYTRTGWKRHIRSRLLTKTVGGASIEPWVLGEEERESLSKRLKRRYFDQYIASWKRFLRGLSLRRGKDARDTLAIVEQLTDAPSLYRDLLDAILHHTQLAKDPRAGRNRRRGGASMAARRLLRGRAARAANAARYSGADKLARKALAKGSRTPADFAFLPLQEMVAPEESPDGRAQIAGFNQYLSELEKVRDALSASIQGGLSNDKDDSVGPAVREARRVTKGILATLPGDLRRLVAPLLFSPLEDSANAAEGVTHAAISSSSKSEICGGFQERLAGRYPFARSSRDALMQDVQEFFSPSGTVWSYYERRLKTRLPRRGDLFVVAPNKTVPRSVVAFINGSWKVSRALFPFGSEKIRVRFEVRPLPARIKEGSGHQVSEIVLEVEGKAKTYRNGPPEQWKLTWRGAGERSRLLVRGARGLRQEIAFTGEWALLRLFDRSKVTRKGSWQRVEWRLKNGEIKIPMDVRPARSHNPFFQKLRLICR